MEVALEALRAGKPLPGIHVVSIHLIVEVALEGPGIDRGTGRDAGFNPPYRGSSLGSQPKSADADGKARFQSTLSWK